MYEQAGRLTESGFRAARSGICKFADGTLQRKKETEKDFGCKNQHDAGIRYDQENNTIEQYLKKLKAAGSIDFWHESCNVESVACAIEGVGGKWKVNKNSWEGYGDVLFDFLNSKANENKIPVNDAQSPSNEIMDNLAYAAKLFADVNAVATYYDNSKHIDEAMEEMLRRGSAVVFSYTPTEGGGGHYNCMVTYSSSKDIFIGHDPWPGCPHCKNKGVFEEFTRKYLRERCRPRLLEISKA